MLCTCIAFGLAVPCISSRAALFDDIIGLGEFGIDAPMCPVFTEKHRQNFTAIFPLRRIHASDASDQALVLRQLAVLPIMHNHKQVSAMLRAGQMPGVSEIIVYVEGHPCTVAHWRVSLSLR